jgi:hypothetical protein
MIDWTNDDAVRRHYEEKLFQRAYEELGSNFLGDLFDSSTKARSALSNLTIDKFSFLALGDFNQRSCQQERFGPILPRND